MKVLVAMSGGVDSSVAAAELRREGHDVVGVTMRLWGGESDTGCCSVSDVDDARRVAQQLRIDHLVFNFSEEFNDTVVSPYVDAHRNGTTPNPCIECNRHLKFDRLSQRARLLGFDAVATGHHARIERQPSGVWRVARGADTAKDQSYVVHMLDQKELAYTLFPVGHLTKTQVRERASELGLRTASKPDSQDVCFISKTGGRETFLGHRIPFRRARVVDESGTEVGAVDAVELVTIGQRRGLRLPGGSPKQFVLAVDVEAGTVVVGDESRLACDTVMVGNTRWSHEPPALGASVLVQTSAHGVAREAVLEEIVGDARATNQVVLRWREPQRRVAPGQSVVMYDDADRVVLGGGIAL
ncbi:MAG: tRNA 2-thiouridine(34) synthase MnmA [Actinobacteria bacterium]|nr:tRNA 2-thiouridine(34) synthase MnmA [Actinomycetota bacterium]NBU06213.1 tRNA 2-thiouridine(34) synthase MnmA [Acidimicrobiia bacterium]NDE20116.1 tRNA 2-thiouridine(34) synthase MnmA [Actinomycetota bacterium]NDF68256.1 tRNA 2-thiouridine(34) synthase MnmA [Actinomycetota bacterium]NDG10606.1 tRNA 2-thiouridine(34) synthase MnmA [Actinomycetota bacterium]